MPNENVYTEAHGFKFPNGTTIPIEDAEARQDISEIKSSLSQLAKKDWIKIDEAGDTAKTVNIAAYNEVLLLFQRISDGVILSSSNAPTSLVSINPLFAVFFDGANIFLGKVYDNGSKLVSNNSNYKAILYAR